MKEQTKNTVVILGTIHADKKQYPNYIENLSKIIREINPQIICAELSPEQLQSNNLISSKPEYHFGIMPVVRNLNIEIVPIQPATKIGIEIEQKKKDFEIKINENEIDKIKWDFLDDFTTTLMKNLYSLIDQPSVFENLQMKEFDLWFYESWYQFIQKHFSEINEHWIEWNQMFLENIIEVIKNNEGKRILVTVGLDHKFWLIKKLREIKDIDVHNLHSFRQRLESF